jgi:hypothetical protein
MSTTYKNNGYQRFTTLTIQTSTNGSVSATDVLPFMSSFTYSGTTYPDITTNDIQSMSLNDYNARAAAYASYVQANYQSQYPGLTVSATGSRVQNLTACPLPS